MGISQIYCTVGIPHNHANSLCEFTEFRLASMAFWTKSEMFPAWPSRMAFSIFSRMAFEILTPMHFSNVRMFNHKSYVQQGK